MRELRSHKVIEMLQLKILTFNLWILMLSLVLVLCLEITETKVVTENFSLLFKKFLNMLPRYLFKFLWVGELQKL